MFHRAREERELVAAWVEAARARGGDVICDPLQRFVVPRGLSRMVVRLQLPGLFGRLPFDAYGSIAVVNPERVRFHVTGRSLFDQPDEYYFPERRTMGVPELDARFFFRTTLRFDLAGLLSRPPLSTLLPRAQLREMSLHGESLQLVSALPEGASELRFRLAVPDLGPERISGILEFGEALLDAWLTDVRAQPGYDFPIGRLRGPGERRSSQDVLIWDGEGERVEAVRLLGRRGLERDTIGLLTVLQDPSPEIRAAVIDALAEIASPRSLPALVRLLGDPVVVDGRSLGQRAAERLRSLGRRDLLAPFEAGMAGSPGFERSISTGVTHGYIAAFTNAVEDPDGSRAAAAASALARLGARSALPALRRRRERLGVEEREALARFTSVIEELESGRDLPLPASAPDPDSSTLPRPAEHGGPPPTSLPRPSDGRKD